MTHKEAKKHAKSLRPWYKKKRFIIPGAVILLVILMNLFSGGGDSPPPAAQPTETDVETVEPTDDAETQPVETEEEAEPTEAEVVETTPPEEPEEPEELVPVAAFGSGTHAVGDDIEPGTYRSEGSTTVCYWERVSSFDGEFESIIANGNLSPDIVTIEEGDAGFNSMMCGDWFVVDDTYPEAPATTFGDGTFAVGGHIEPGTYSADGDPEEVCYFARLSDFSGEFDAIISNGNFATIIEISPDDAGFTTYDCGTWTKK